MRRLPATPEAFAARLDATNLRLDASEADLCRLCDEAGQSGYGAVCVYPTSVPLCAALLDGATTAVCTVIGFPHGRSPIETKRREILEAAEAGADEVDIVMNYAALRSGERSLLAEELIRLCETAREGRATSKVIVETCFLDDRQKLEALRLCEDAAADFVKTSTGFGAGGATEADVRRIAENRAADIRVKASGGIRTLGDATALLEAGADRLGVSAAGQLLAAFRERHGAPAAARGG